MQKLQPKNLNKSERNEKNNYGKKIRINKNKQKPIIEGKNKKK